MSRTVKQLSLQDILHLSAKNCILPFDAMETVTNISSHKSTFEEYEALRFGLTHSIVPPYIKKTDIFCMLLDNISIYE